MEDLDVLEVDVGECVVLGEGLVVVGISGHGIPIGTHIISVGSGPTQHGNSPESQFFASISVDKLSK